MSGGRSWTPAEDTAVMAAKPLPAEQRRVKVGEPRPVSELQLVAQRLGRTWMAVCARRSRLKRATGHDS